MRNVDWERVAVLVSVLVPSVILHEVAHGVVARLFGDETAARAGRLTLNPIAHVDVFGTLILPFMTALSGFGAFGYAKPVPVNPRNLRNPRQHSLYVSLAGPATNIVLAAAATLLLRTSFRGDLDHATFGGYLFYDELPLVAQLVLWLGLINVVLTIFNLLPVPPLDGSALVERMLPNRWWPTWLKFRQYGFGLLLVLMLVGATGRVLEPVLDQWLKLI